MNQSFHQNGYLISTDKRRLNVKLIHNFLGNSYWAEGRPVETVKNSIKGSVCFGIYERKNQIGFARVITDKATYGYIADVFILEEQRGKGLSKWLMDVIINKSELKYVKSWFLATKDAHLLYEKFGFKKITEPERFMSMKKS